jgi:regulator of sigma E protease
MAIISAGVIMNVIFAFIFAAIAFGLGVPYNPSVVTRTAPGSPAWQADLRPGDEIVQIDDIRDPSFAELRGGVTLGDLDNGVPFRIRRGDVEQEKTLKPQQDGGLARVGIFPPDSLTLAKEAPTAPGSPADATGGFRGGDVVTAVDGQTVDSYAQYAAQLAARPGEPLQVQVRRGAETATVELPPHPMRRLGLIMTFGKIVAVQENSPAAQLDPPLRAGDFIEKFADANAANRDDDDALPWDPVTTPQRLAEMAEQFRTVRLTLRRSTTEGEGTTASETVQAPLRRVEWLESPLLGKDAVAATALGIAYRVLNRVDSVVPGSPAAQQGLQSGDMVVSARFVYPSDVKSPAPSGEIVFGEEEGNNWAGFLAALQWQPPGTQVELTYRRGEEQRQVTLDPAVAPGEFVAERGLQFAPLERIRKAASFQEQLERGWQETVGALGMVYRFLSKLGTQIPLTSLGGPVTIAKAAGYSAFDGMGKLLTFLTMLSANLAVINFLPIPLLDGGHMVFLAYEGIRGKPAGEKFVVAMHTIGFVFIISLMLFVISLDLGLIQRNL